VEADMVVNIDQFLTAKSNAVAVHDSFIPAENYFSVLANATRIHILKFIAAGAKDCHTISREVGLSYIGCQKHLKKLLEVGLIKKAVGIGRETSKGKHPAYLYSLNDENHFDRTLSEHIREGLNHGNDKRDDVVFLPRYVHCHVPNYDADEQLQYGGES
jgi:predicted transcriptional regulator